MNMNLVYSLIAAVVITSPLWGFVLIMTISDNQAAKRRKEMGL